MIYEARKNAQSNNCRHYATPLSGKKTFALHGPLCPPLTNPASGKFSDIEMKSFKMDEGEGGKAESD